MNKLLSIKFLCGLLFISCAGMLPAKARQLAAQPPANKTAAVPGSLNNAAMRQLALNGPSIQIDPSFAYYKNRSNESIVNEIELAGYRCVHYFVVNEKEVNGELIRAFQQRGIPVWMMALGNGTYSTKGLPEGWEQWKMKLLKRENGADGFTFFTPFNPHFVQWKKQVLVNLMNTYGFDGMELAESYFPEWDAIKSGLYGDLSEWAAARFQQQYGQALPEFLDTAAANYYKKIPAVYANWVQCRVDAVNDMLQEVYNGPGGIREKCPGRLVATWTLGLDAGPQSVPLLREHQGMDAAAMIAKVKPDLHYIQTHWPDWGKSEQALPPDYMKTYTGFYNQIREAGLQTPIALQADIGSSKNMIKSGKWVAAFSDACVQYKYAGWTAYEYHLGGYIYQDAPAPVKAARTDSKTIRISFSKRIDSATAASPDAYQFYKNGKALKAVVQQIQTDGNQVALTLKKKLPPNTQIGFSGIKDTPGLWLYKGYEAHTVAPEARVTVQ
ncbi:MAG: hypothetical protein P0Y53_24425 [Candidatus Pseudobacter hemicellulosilyticus]|uniref:N-acyl-D-glucosamine 2-epimerase n=1 Tax=Candidatus Pseudobacter hemicellulosilyticus TaxID=3121375 RepID=A0AAJ6BH86_9BACT|nr:MAG: hypothetical protein P0Y53_24425 [Pseudobacter sp.]